MNILNNAIDALEKPPFSTNDALKENSRSLLLTSHPPSVTIRTQFESSQAKIYIADKGLGMLADVQQKLFDPFFTTKPIGKGTGMGLAICYQIVVDQHQGTIDVSSTLGQGTEFCITLPCQQLINKEPLQDCRVISHLGH